MSLPGLSVLNAGIPESLLTALYENRELITIFAKMVKTKEQKIVSLWNIRQPTEKKNE
jgi:hypothetical protein